MGEGGGAETETPIKENAGFLVHKERFLRITVNIRIQEPMVSGFRLIKFLFTGCLVRNQSENVLKMFLKFASKIIYIIHY